MIIDYAIVSTNDNPTYKDFWEVVKPVWINHIKIKPILVNMVGGILIIYTHHI